ncbi:hypothetical protein AAFF_G00024350 [Aldrovandia affinis]|uniref:Uncharacterized protein n=1 Tax=Aldrovandia affinis TaxID=143900 RepID=A0AAD7WZG7_9TELE|nr:hypothetical protein AAFF_G00024350 [Aldrovandia affinis]
MCQTFTLQKIHRNITRTFKFLRTKSAGGRGRLLASDRQIRAERWRRDGSWWSARLTRRAAPPSRLTGVDDRPSSYAAGQVHDGTVPLLHTAPCWPPNRSLCLPPGCEARLHEPHVSP